MVEATPSTAFEVAEPNLLLEFLIIALDAPAQFGDVDETAQGRRLVARVESQYLLGSFSPCGPLDQQPFLRPAVQPANNLDARARTRTRANREDRRSAVPSRHSIMRQARLGRPTRERLDRDRPMFGVTADQLRRSSLT